MKRNFTILSLLFCILLFGQERQKKYKYVIVPLQYNFTTEPNQYQLNVLTRVVLKQEGFEVFMSEGEKIPNHVLNNKCKSLKADVKKDNGLFTTNLKFQLYNCYGSLVYESLGSSREKGYGTAYKEALREALSIFQAESSKYVKLSGDEAVDVNLDISAKEAPQPTFDELATAYKFNGEQFWMMPKEKDYTIYSDKGETIRATLNYADRGTYNYKSDTIEGAAYFTPEGNLIVEYLAKDKDAVQEIIYKKQ